MIWSYRAIWLLSYFLIARVADARYKETGSRLFELSNPRQLRRNTYAQQARKSVIHIFQDLKEFWTLLPHPFACFSLGFLLSPNKRAICHYWVLTRLAHCNVTEADMGAAPSASHSCPQLPVPSPTKFWQRVLRKDCIAGYGCIEARNESLNLLTCSIISPLACKHSHPSLW
jgi:hypothetical protein